MTLFSVVQPLRKMVGAVERHARDEEGAELEPSAARDEIGQLGRAILQCMKNHARKALEAAEERRKQQEERWRQDKERHAEDAKRARAVELAVREIGGGLSQLSAGNLSYQIETLQRGSGAAATGL